jgi:hypothetical protein
MQIYISCLELNLLKSMPTVHIGIALLLCLRNKPSTARSKYSDDTYSYICFDTFVASFFFIITFLFQNSRETWNIYMIREQTWMYVNNMLNIRYTHNQWLIFISYLYLQSSASKIILRNREKVIKVKFVHSLFHGVSTPWYCDG